MANVPNGVETLPKNSITWVRHTNVTDRQTRRQTDGQRHIANVNVSSRLLKTNRGVSARPPHHKHDTGKTFLHLWSSGSSV